MPQDRTVTTSDTQGNNNMTINRSSVMNQSTLDKSKIKRSFKPPEVKLNLASKLRMEKAHPIEFYKRQIEILKSTASTPCLEKTNNSSIFNNSLKPNRPSLLICSGRLTSTVKQPVHVTKSNNMTQKSHRTNKDTSESKNLTLGSNTKLNKVFKKPDENKLSKNITGSSQPVSDSTNIKNNISERKSNASNKMQGKTQINSNSIKTKKNFSTSTSRQVPTTKTETKKCMHLKNTTSTVSNNKVNIQNINKTVQNDKKIFENNKVINEKKNEIKSKYVRRSLSAVHFKRVNIREINSLIVKTQSLEDIPQSEKKVRIITPIKEEQDSILFKTPKLNVRRSIAFSTPASSRKSLISSSPVGSTPLPKVLQKRLNDWLEKRGKSLGSFHHLKCFGVHLEPLTEQYNEENKENIEATKEMSDSYTNLHIKNQPEETKDSKELFSIAKDALYDLHKLILEGYPRQNCEAWLSLIQTKFDSLEEQPQYWECRAALEEVRGNFSSAVDCYQKAIIKGAEVKEVDESLEHLLEKFSVLNLSPENKEKLKDQEKKRNPKTILDARNIFKSSIINFAIQERTLKNNKANENDVGMKFIATPVRRSTRLSRSNFTSTPGVTMYSSLNQLEEPVRQSLQFKSNRALIT